MMYSIRRRRGVNGLSWERKIYFLSTRKFRTFVRVLFYVYITFWKTPHCFKTHKLIIKPRRCTLVLFYGFRVLIMSVSDGKEIGLPI